MNDGCDAALRAPYPHLFPAAHAEATAPAGGAADVAVVMRTKDRALLLHRALSSVLMQTYPHWHIYLVNDGGDRAVLEAMLPTYLPALDGRLTVIHHERSQGMERASNAALLRARQEFVVVHDDDDAWHPDFLATATRFLGLPANRHYVAVATGCTVVRERIEEGQAREVAREDWLLGTAVIDYARMLAENQFPPICLLFRRRAVQEIGSYNGELPVLGDWEFNLRLMLLGDIGYVARPLAYYHHRLPGAQGGYGNTVVDGTAVHEAQNIRLRNAMLRAALAGRPEALGLLHPLLRAATQRDPGKELVESVVTLSTSVTSVDARLARIERELGELRGFIGDIRTVASWHRKMLWPVQRVYSTLRRLAGRG